MSEGETPETTAQVAENQNTNPVQDTEQEFDAKRAMALIEKLRAEVKELKPKAKQAEELAAAQKAKEESEMTELQKAQKRLADIEAELRSERKAALVQRVASKFELPQALADRLHGETPEELEADAKKLLEAIKPPETRKAPGPLNPGADAQAGETEAQKIARITGGTSYRSIFEQGSGVRWSE